MRRLLLLLAGLCGAAGPAIAQDRPIGTVYYECRTEFRFTLPGKDGTPRMFHNPSRPKEPAWPESAAGAELIGAEITVEADGAVSALRITWMQAGLLGWPYFAQVGSDDISLYVGFGGRYPLHPDHRLAPQAQFDPEKLFVAIDARERRKIRRPLALELRRPGVAGMLGGLADVPPWRHSAGIGLWWPQLRDFAGGVNLLDVDIHELIVGREGLERRRLRSGHVDLSVMPAVIARFREAEQRVRAMVPDRERACRKEIVPEHDPRESEEIAIE